MNDIKKGLVECVGIALSEGCEDSRSAVKFLVEMMPSLSESKIFLNLFPIMFNMAIGHQMTALKSKSDNGHVVPE